MTLDLKLIISPEKGTEKRIKLCVAERNREFIKIFFDIVWSDSELGEWLSINREYLLKEELPAIAPSASCIAESMARFYDKEIDPPEIDFDIMYTYRARHGFRFALRGANIPDVYLGLCAGNHQVSLIENGQPYHAFVSIDSLMDEFD